MVNYILKSKIRIKVRDEIDKLIKKDKKKIWININNLVADAYYRGKHKK